MYRFALIVLLLSPLTACSLLRLPPLTPQPQANLISPCPQLEMPPNPLVDPYRAEWESSIISAYTLCAAKQYLNGSK